MRDASRNPKKATVPASVCASRRAFSRSASVSRPSRASVAARSRAATRSRVSARCSRQLARSGGDQKEQVLGSIFGLSSALAGPLDLEEIGRRFLSTVRGALDSEVTVALIVYDDVLEAFRTIAADGPMGADLHGQTYSASALPAIIRTRVIDHRRSLILSNTGTDADTWAKLSHDMPQVASARSFGALPLVSRDRLVGPLLLLSGRAA